MTPDELRERTFPVVLRGYERSHVDNALEAAASELARLSAELERSQQEQGAEARTAPAADTAGSDDATAAYRALGERTTAILVQAEQAAGSLRREAEEAAGAMRSEASTWAEATRKEADDHARTAREEADEHARTVTVRARRQAETDRSAAERAARERVDAAASHARQLVAEAEAQRDEALAERDAVVARREQLAQELRDVLARLAGEADALLPAAPAPTVADTAGGERSAQRRAAARDAVDVDEGQDPADVAVAAAPVGRDDDAVGEDDAAASAASPAPEAPVEEGDRAEVTPPSSDDEDDDDEVDAPTARAVAHHATGRGQSSLAAAAASAGGPAGRDARGPVVPPNDTRSAGPDDAGPDDEEPDVVPLAARREQALVRVRPPLLRALRRGVQDLQDAALAAVRTPGDVAPRPGAVLPDDAAADELAATATALLRSTWSRGRDDAAAVLGVEDPVGEGHVDEPAVAAAASSLGASLVDALRTTLRPSLAAGIDAGEPAAALAERVGEVFRDLKGPVVEAAAEEQLVALHGAAALAAWSDAGVAATRWERGDERRCPEDLCRGNAAQGPVPIGEPFPSGHAAPPVHQGCTCGLAPASGATEGG